MKGRQAPPKGVRFPRPDRRALLLGLRPPQVAVLGASVAVVVAVLMVLPSVLGMVLAAVIAGVGVSAATGRVRGQALDEWLPVAARFASLVVTRRSAWRSSVTSAGRTRRTPDPVPPPPLARLALLRVRSGGNEIAIVKDRVSSTYTAVLRCRGQAFALLDGTEQDRLTGLWGDVLASFAHEGSPVTRLGWVERALPEEGDALEAYLRAGAVVDEAHPAYGSYAELIDAAGPATEQHETYLTVTVGGARARRLIAKAGGGDAGAGQVLLRELATLAERLRSAEIEVIEALEPRRLAAALRVAFDPGSARALARRSRVDPARAGTVEHNAWPLATRTAWDHYRTDSGYHTTYWVAEWPRREMPPSFLHPLLLRPEVRRAVAVVMEPVPPSKAARAVESAHAAHVADEDLRARVGYLPSARRRQEHEAIVDRERELAEGHADCRFGAYVTVTGSTRDELEEATGEIEQFAFDAQLELRRIYGQQDVAFTYTLPLGRGLS